MTLKQEDIATHLGISQPAVSEMLSRLGLDHRTQSLDEIRLAYINHLRSVAAGRAASGGIDLATERALLARSQRERVDLQNAIKRREYGPIAALELGMADTMAQVVSHFDTIVPKLKRSNPKLSTQDLDVVAGVLAQVRNTVADMEIDWFDDGDDPEEIDEADDVQSPEDPQNEI